MNDSDGKSVGKLTPQYPKLGNKKPFDTSCNGAINYVNIAPRENPMRKCSILSSNCQFLVDWHYHYTSHE